MKNLNRRKFIRNTAYSGAGLAVGSTLGSCATTKTVPASNGQYMGGFAAPKLETVRAAFIGVGYRGPNHLRFLAKLDGFEVVGIADLYEDNVKKEVEFCQKVGAGQRHQKIGEYYGSEDKWRLMLDEVKPNVVFVCTNWKNHAPMVIEAMKKGAHAFVEVPMALTIEEMWEIVNTSEETQKHCMMMENVNYGRDELMYLNMCQKGVIGELLHAEAAYIHELRGQGDLNTSIIKTTMGKTIMIQWDETSPRPYSRHNLVQGTMGTLAGFPTRVAIEGGVEGSRNF